MANEKITEDPRIDPRIKAIFGMMPAASSSGNVNDRETLLAEMNTKRRRLRNRECRCSWKCVITKTSHLPRV